MKRAARRPAAPETRDRLLDVALTLFADRGYDAVGVREIIRAAGVTEPVLYYYFKGKEALFLHLLRVHYAEAQAELARLLRDTPGCFDRLRLLLTGTFLHAARDPRIPRLFYQTHCGPRLPGITEPLAELTAQRFALVTEVMRAGIRSGDLRGDSAEELALCFCSLMDTHVHALCRLTGGARQLTAVRAERVLALFRRGAESSTA